MDKDQYPEKHTKEAKEIASVSCAGKPPFRRLSQFTSSHKRKRCGLTETIATQTNSVRGTCAIEKSDSSLMKPTWCKNGVNISASIAASCLLKKAVSPKTPIKKPTSHATVYPFPPYRSVRKVSVLTASEKKRKENLTAQAHRLKEKQRHSEINELIDQLGSHIPLPEKLCETKVLTLQRIISYFCFMEKKIVLLSEELGIDSEDSGHPLTLLLNKQVEIVEKDSVHDSESDSEPVALELLSAYKAVIDEYPEVLKNLNLHSNERLTTLSVNSLKTGTEHRKGVYKKKCNAVKGRQLRGEKHKDLDFLLCDEVLSEEDEDVSLYEENEVAAQKLCGILSEECNNDEKLSAEEKESFELLQYWGNISSVNINANQLADQV